MTIEMATENHDESVGPFARGCGWLKALPKMLWAKVTEVARKMKKLGQDDPRKIVHSLKVGLAITLVSLFYYFHALYEGFGVSAMWAVLTVVVVLEFSVGTTLGRGLNRMLATLLAGALGIGAHRLATLSGETGEPILLGFFVFVIAAVVTFLRFFPKLKARYDYGLMIFILTFCLVSVSGYRDDDVLNMAQQRLTAIIIGSCTSILVCIVICPVWVGEDLHNQVATNIEKLGNFLEGFGDEYFSASEDRQTETINKSFLQGYKSVLSSKNSEENMANLARWEPGHGGFRFRHPWKQYLKVGTLTRQCAYKLEALHSYLNSQIQTPGEFRSKIQEPCTRICSESSKALKELSSAIKTMTTPLADPQIANLIATAENLKSLLKTGLWEDTNLLEMTPAAAVASLLIDVVTCTENILEAVHELASLAQFKGVSPEQPQLLHRGTVQPLSECINGQHHVITVGE